MNYEASPDDVLLTDVGDLALALGGDRTSWTGEMLRLVAKSDPARRATLRAGVPNLVRAYETWHAMSPTPTVREFLDRMEDGAPRERQAAALETAAALVRHLQAVPGAVGTVTVSESGAVRLALRDHGTPTLTAFLTVLRALGYAAGQHYDHGAGMVGLELADDDARWRGVPLEVTAVVGHAAADHARRLTPERES